jgi:hypothetical protein
MGEKNNGVKPLSHEDINASSRGTMPRSILTPIFIDLMHFSILDVDYVTRLRFLSVMQRNPRDNLRKWPRPFSPMISGSRPLKTGRGCQKEAAERKRQTDRPKELPSVLCVASFF